MSQSPGIKLKNIGSNLTEEEAIAFEKIRREAGFESNSDFIKARCLGQDRAIEGLGHYVLTIIRPSPSEPIKVRIEAGRNNIRDVVNEVIEELGNRIG